ncbi:MAG: YraN family protein [Planctomycetes bacterium]|nr:YraN family protein [Planctomycetota bacterium]
MKALRRVPELVRALTRRATGTPGGLGEKLAAKFLKKSGYTILQRNYDSGVGEIDLVAADGETLCFVEVKTRRSDDFGLPEESVTQTKQRQLAKAAQRYLAQKKVENVDCRFDVVSVLLDADLKPIETRLIKDAFSLPRR